MDRAMDIVKKNLLSIIFGVIALIAVLLAIWPISGWFTDLQTKASARVSVYNQLRDLLTKERHKPSVALTSETETERLEYFPTPAIIDRGSRVKADIEGEAKAIQDAAVKINRGDKKLLVEGSLPQPRDPAVAGRFVQEYSKAIDYTSPNVNNRAQSLPMKIMRAGLAPTTAEIEAEKLRVASVIRRNDLQVDSKGKPINQEQVQTKIAEQQARVPDQLRADAASRCAIYVEPGSLHVMSNIVQDARARIQAPAIFWAQMSLWLQQDVWKALAEVNANAKDVTQSPVKRIIKIEVPTDFTTPAAPKAGGDEGDGAMIAMPADPTQPIEKNFAFSPTGRYSNPLYDVMQFKLTLIVEADSIPAVLQGLSRNRFITVYETDITAVDSGVHQSAGYVYGPKPVVQLELQCEALFLREWTKQYMPRGIRSKLGIVDEQPVPMS